MTAGKLPSELKEPRWWRTRQSPISEADGPWVDGQLRESPTNIDVSKRIRFDSALGCYGMIDCTVHHGVIQRPAAIRLVSADIVTLGNGHYNMEAVYLGGGFSYRMD